MKSVGKYGLNSKSNPNDVVTVDEAVRSSCGDVGDSTDEDVPHAVSERL